MLFEFSHIDFQRNLWIERKYENAIGWFAEDMCRYFDDLSLEDQYNHQLMNGMITNKEFEVIKDFHKALDNYDEMGKTDLEILEDSKWQEIVNVARSAWDNLKLVIEDRDELEHMFGLEKNYELKSEG